MLGGLKGYGKYVALFDECSELWTKDAKANLEILLGAQRVALRMYDAWGYLFLDDVCDILEIPSPDGKRRIGWSKHHGGNIGISFGIYKPFNEANVAFHEGSEPSIWLDFNCDGDIVNFINR